MKKPPFIKGYKGGGKVTEGTPKDEMKKSKPSSKFGKKDGDKEKGEE